MTSWFGFHSTNWKAPVPTGCFPNSKPHFSTAFGLATSKTNISRLARNGACGSLRVIRTVWEPTASTFETIDLSSKPPNCASQYSNVWPALTWFSCWAWPDLPALEVPDDRGGVEGRVIVKLHVAAELERPHPTVPRHLPFL